MTQSCVCESCPRAVSTVNITQNLIEVDGSAAGFDIESFVLADVTAGAVTLTNTPLDNDSIWAFLNGVAETNITPTGASIALGFTMEADDTLVIHYFWSA